MAATAASEGGGKSLLLEEGLTTSEAAAARCLALLPEHKFEDVLKTPAAPTTIAHRLWDKAPIWKQFSRGTSLIKALLERNTPADLTAGIRACGDRELVEARDRVRFMIDQLTELQRLLGGERDP